MARQFARHLIEFVNGNGGTAKTLDFSANGFAQSLTLNSASCALTLVGPSVSAKVFLRVIQDATGSRAITFVTTVNGTAPTIATAANSSSVIELYWNGTAWFWGVAGTSAVSSVFARTGAVVAVAGDYAASKINNDSSTVTGTHVSDALDNLKSGYTALVVGVSSVFGRAGAVVAAAGDYAASKINNDSSTVSGTHVSDALDALKALIAASVTGVSSFNTRGGAVVPVTGDYAASNITNDSTVTGTGVAAALNTLGTAVSNLLNFKESHTYYVDAAYAGSARTGSEVNPYNTIVEAVAAAVTAGNSIVTFFIQPGTYSGAFTIAGAVTYRFIEVGYCGDPQVNVTGQVSWVMTNGANISWFGCVVRTSGGAGPIVTDDIAAGTGVCHWNVLGGWMGVQTNGNSGAAAFTHNFKLRAAFFRANGWSEVVPSAIQPQLDGFNTIGASAGYGQVQVTEGTLAGPGPYKCGIIRMRDSSVSAASTTLTTAGAGSTFEGATNYASGFVLNNAGTAGVISFEPVSLYYWVQDGASQSGGVNTITPIAIDQTAEFNAGNGGSALALDLTKNVTQHITLNSTTCALSITAAKYPIEPNCNVTLRISQDATGGRALTYSTDFAGNVPLLDATASHDTLIFLRWVASTGKFYFVGSTSSLYVAITSFNGRTTAAALPTTGDYLTSQITNDSTVSGTFAADALNNLLKQFSTVATRSTSFTLSASDYAALYLVTANITVTVPLTPGTPLTNGIRVVFVLSGGTLTITPASGVTINTLGIMPTSTNSIIVLDKIGNNTWLKWSPTGPGSSTFITNGSSVSGTTVTDALNTVRTSAGIFDPSLAGGPTIEDSFNTVLDQITQTALSGDVSIQQIVSFAGTPGWDFNSTGIGWCSKFALGEAIWLAIGPIPPGAHITGVKVSIWPNSGHTLMPATLPTLSVYEQRPGTGGFTLLGSVVTDASSGLGFYEVAHSLVSSFSPLAAGTTSIWAKITAENDATHGVSGMTLINVSETLA